MKNEQICVVTGGVHSKMAEFCFDKPWFEVFDFADSFWK